MNFRKIFFALLAVGLFTYSICELMDFIKSRQQSNQWTLEQKIIMIRDCVKTSKVLSSIDTTTANIICSCAVEKLTIKYTYNQIWKIDKKSKVVNANIANLFKPIMEECMDPHLKEIKEKMEIVDCVNAATKNNKMKKERAINYCTCFITYLHDKYSEQELDSLDLIMKTEMEKAKECIDNTTK